MYCRGVRGATTADKNSRESIIEATLELLELLVKENDVREADIASVIFTTTPDLNAEFPAVAARQMGWLNTALLCGHEMNVPEGLDHCIRVLMHLNTNKTADEIKHVYIRGAESLRPGGSEGTSK